MMFFLQRFINEYVTFGRIRPKFKYLYNIKVWLGFSSFVLFSSIVLIFILSYFFGIHLFVSVSPVNDLISVFCDFFLPLKEICVKIFSSRDYSESFLFFKGYIIRYTFVCLRFIGYNFEGLFVFFIVKLILKIWLGYHLIYSFLSVKQDYLQRFKLINTMLFMGILIFFFFRDYIILFNIIDGKFMYAGEILSIKNFNKINRTKIVTEYFDSRSYFFNRVVYILSLLKINFDVYENFLSVYYFRNKMYFRYYYMLESLRFKILNIYFKNRRPNAVKRFRYLYRFYNNHYGRFENSNYGFVERYKLYKDYYKISRAIQWPPRARIMGGWNVFGVVNVGGKKEIITNREYCFRYKNLLKYYHRGNQLFNKLNYVQHRMYYDERGVSASNPYKNIEVIRLRFKKS